MTMMKSRRRPSEGVDEPQEVGERLAGLLPEGVLEDVVKGLRPDELSGPGGLLWQLAGRVVEAALEAEMTEHLGRPPGGVPAGPNVRNGVTRKSVQTDLGPVEVATPRGIATRALSRSWSPSARPDLAGLRRQGSRASTPEA